MASNEENTKGEKDKVEVLDSDTLIQLLKEKAKELK